MNTPSCKFFEMNEELRKAALSCQRNQLATLQSLVPAHVNPNDLVPQIKLNLLSRQKVPLICIAAASGSLDCVKYLTKTGANLDAYDDHVPFYFF